MYKSHKQITNVYVHLPFCKNKCHFCAFPVHAVGSQPNQPLMEQYIHQLTTEIQISKKYLNLNSPISSLYFGGGTPSLQSPT
jgi:oxygen-independent coproporphyrinogen-3 oxidase